MAYFVVPVRIIRKDGAFIFVVSKNPLKMNGLKILLYQMSQIRYTKCPKFVIPNVPNIRITRYNIYRIYKYRSSKEQSFIGLPLLDRYFILWNLKEDYSLHSVLLAFSCPRTLILASSDIFRNNLYWNLHCFCRRPNDWAEMRNSQCCCVTSW